MAEKLYKFFWDCGRQGNIEGLFVAEEEQLQEIVDKPISFGEALGKHSDIYGTLEEEDLTVVSEDPVVIDALRDYPVGYNPLDYFEE